MPNKKEYQPALELTKMSLKVQALEGKVRNLELGQKVPDDLENRAKNLREALRVLKQRINMGHRQPDDNYRQLALEVELGRTLCLIDGVL